MKTELVIARMRRDLEEKIEELDALLASKKELEKDTSMRGWECTSLFQRKTNYWKLTYKRKLNLCGREIFEEQEASILL